MEIKFNVIKEYITKERIKIFFTTMITMLLVHFHLYSQILTGADTLLVGPYNTAKIYEATLRKIWPFLYASYKR